MHIHPVIKQNIRLLCMLPFLIALAGAALAADGFRIDYLSLNRSVAYLGEEITVSYIVQAPTAKKKQTVHLHFYLDDSELGSQAIGDFDASGRREASFSFPARPQGRFQLRAVLSSDAAGNDVLAREQRQLAILSLPGIVTEESAAPTAATGAPAQAPDQDPLPDLTPVGLAFDIPSPARGEKTAILTTIANKGTADAKNVKLRVFIDGLPLAKDASFDIAAGGKVTVKTAYVPNREGQKDILVMVNPDSTLDELSGRNNIISQSLIVRPAKKTRVAAGPGPAAARKARTTPAGKKASARKQKPKPLPATPSNLVAYIETIDGVHYTPDGRLHVFVSNNSRANPSPPFTVGVRRLSATGDKRWLAHSCAGLELL